MPRLRSCVPFGVPYGRLMEHTRSQVLDMGKGSRRLRLVKALFLRGALPHANRLALLLRFYQRWGLQRLVRASRLLKRIPGGLAELEAQLPTMSPRFFVPTSEVYPAVGVSKMKVGLLSGCVMLLMQGATMDALVRVLTRNGCDVAVPLGQGCCGALNLHSGDIDMGGQMARRNIDVFHNAGVERVVVASAGCGSAMKEYGELFSEDLEYQEKAERFMAMVMDITELLASLPFQPPKGTVSRRVTYQDPCQLAHAQRITQAPRVILKSIPGLELVEMENATMCCGAAGIYSLTQTLLSRQILESKMEKVAGTRADTIVTANPGCMIQLEAGRRLSNIPGRVCHVVDILDEAYRAEESLA